MTASSLSVARLISIDVLLLVVFALTANVTLRGVLAPQRKAERSAIDRVRDAGWLVSELQPFGVELRCESTDRLCEFASLDVDALRVLAWLHGHVVVERVRTMNQSEFEIQAARFGPLLRWKFGYTFHVKPEINFTTTVTSRGKTPIHFDGMFYSHVPSFQLFQCVIAPDDGGETTFVHTVPFVRNMSAELRARARQSHIGYFTPHIDYFGGAVRSFPLVRPHPFLRNTDVLLWHEPHDGIQPVTRTPDSDAAKALLDIIDRADISNDPRYARFHRWNANQIVIADNIGQLHGRRPFGPETPRLLWRIHVM